jgi:hypothetical protein
MAKAMRSDLKEQALRQIMNAAIDIERGDEIPRVAARDIQLIALAALEGRALPDIFALYPKRAVSGS